MNARLSMLDTVIILQTFLLFFFYSNSANRKFPHVKPHTHTNM